MFFKVITIILITICAADNRKLLTELDTEQEIPALLFNGHVLFPKIYKYTKVDQYTHSTLRSKLRPVRAAASNLFQKLQYAPLHDGVSQKSKNADEEYTNPRPTPSSAPSEQSDFFLDKKNTQLYAKSHLEPRPEATDTKCYAPGFHVEASVSRSPGHNAVYRIIPEVIEIEKPVQVLLSQTEANPAPNVGRNSLAAIVSSNLYGGVAWLPNHLSTQTRPASRRDSPQDSGYVKPIAKNLKLETLPTTIKPSLDIASEHADRPLTLSDEHFVINPDVIETVLQDKSKRYTPHAKYHRLHLNIARVYSPGQVPPQSAVFRKINPENYGRRQLHPQPYAPQTYPDMNMNTMLYPVKRHRKGYRFRTSVIRL